MSLYSVDKLISEARKLAAEFRRTTGKSLGISAEIARHDACEYLGLEPDEEAIGYDAVGSKDLRKGLRYQIKGRAIFDESKGGQRIGQLKLEQDWDAVVLVLMDENYDATEIYEARHEDIVADLNESQASKRAKRGAMSVARFKHIAELVWTRENGQLDNEVWSNQATP